MKPYRISMTDALVMGYGLSQFFDELHDIRPATMSELEQYHDSDYVEFLSKWVLLYMSIFLAL